MLVPVLARVSDEHLSGPGTLEVGDEVLGTGRAGHDLDELPAVSAPLVEDLLGGVGDEGDGDVLPSGRRGGRGYVVRGCSHGAQPRARPGAPEIRRHEPVRASGSLQETQAPSGGAAHSGQDAGGAAGVDLSDELVVLALEPQPPVVDLGEAP